MKKIAAGESASESEEEDIFQKKGVPQADEERRLKAAFKSAAKIDGEDQDGFMVKKTARKGDSDSSDNEEGTGGR